MTSSRKIMVVIQSRLASTRLPDKALLPLRGIPLVLLCARRAANNGLNVAVATSDEEVDNYKMRLFSKSQALLVAA
jgi:spore coat polysaccharide biosynthesis protein SpsF (cytidylyltransferase family)